MIRTSHHYSSWVIKQTALDRPWLTSTQQTTRSRNVRLYRDVFKSPRLQAATLNSRFMQPQPMSNTPNERNWGVLPEFHAWTWLCSLTTALELSYHNLAERPSRNWWWQILFSSSTYPNNVKCDTAHPWLLNTWKTFPLHSGQLVLVK